MYKEIPEIIRAGDTVEWVKTVEEYPSTEGWQMVYYLYNLNDYYEITGQGQSDGSFIFKIPININPGKYAWILRVKQGTTVKTIQEGSIEVKPQPGLGVDERSHIRKVYEALQRVLEGRATRSDLEYWVGDKKLKSMTHEEIIKALKLYEYYLINEEKLEKLKKITGNKNLIKTRFT